MKSMTTSLSYSGYLKLDIDNLEQRIAEGYIRRRPHPLYPITLYNYAEKAQYADVWDNEIMNCRGLILTNDTYRPVNGVFPKFFNASPENIPSAPMVSITEKMDGSFISLFNYGHEWITATRGSFDSEQAEWATIFLKRWATRFSVAKTNLNWLSPEWSYMFEAIYPENRVVINYGDRRDLVLLGARHIANGKFMRRSELDTLANKFGMSQPKLFTFGSVNEIFAAIKAIPASQEGWVVEYADNSRLKFKGEAYVLAHRVMTQVTFKRVLEAVAAGKMDDMIEGVPDEFLDEVKKYRSEIDDKVAAIKSKVDDLMLTAPVQGITQPEREYRKQFAAWCFSQVDKETINPHYLLNYGQEGYLLKTVYRTEFDDRLKQEATVGDDDNDNGVNGVNGVSSVSSSEHQ